MEINESVNKLQHFLMENLEQITNVETILKH